MHEEWRSREKAISSGVTGQTMPYGKPTKQEPDQKLYSPSSAGTKKNSWKSSTTRNKQGRTK